MIQNASQLVDVLHRLNESQRTTILDALGSDKLKEMIQNASQLDAVLRLLKEAEAGCKAILDGLGPDKLKEIIQNSRELRSVLQSLNETQGRAVITALGSDKLKKIINNADDLRFILFALNPENRLALMTDLGRNHLTSLLRQCRNGELSAYRGVFIQVYLSLRTADVRAVFVPGLWGCFQPHKEQKMRLAQSLLGNPTQRAHNGLLGLIDRKTRPP
jgi:Mg/Co/Ni transporter MgtE